jgi:mannose-6-phosphate isomerase-like protein (cupin superfamily)
MRHPNVRNADEVEVREMIKGRHNMRLRQLAKPAGSIALGATLTEVAPGGISFPRHAHNVNEEAIYVLSGSGEGRIGDARVPVRPGAVAIGSSAETEPVPKSPITAVLAPPPGSVLETNNKCQIKFELLHLTVDQLHEG